MDSAPKLGNLEAAIAKLTDEKIKADALANKELFEKYYPLMDSDIWKQVHESDDKSVQSYTAQADGGLLMAKGVAQFPFKPEKVRKYTEKMENRPLYDEMHDEGVVFNTIEDKENEVIIFELYSKRSGMKLVDPRDFVCNHVAFKVGDTWMACSHSIEHPSYAEVPKSTVRGQLDFYIFEFAPGEGGKGCTFRRMFRAHPKGSIPDIIVNMVMKNSGMELYDMRKAMLE